MQAAVAGLVASTWSGITWRIHARRYAATDPGGSRRFSGRYHRAPDLFPNQRAWPVLYLGLERGTCIAEATRHAGDLSDLADRRLSEIEVSLSAVLDLRDPTVLGLTQGDLVGQDYTLTQEIALVALERGVEALRVPAASLVGNNLAILVENLLPTSRVQVTGFVDPRLLIDQP